MIAGQKQGKVVHRKCSGNGLANVDILSHKTADGRSVSTKGRYGFKGVPETHHAVGEQTADYRHKQKDTEGGAKNFAYHPVTP